MHRLSPITRLSSTFYFSTKPTAPSHSSPSPWITLDILNLISSRRHLQRIYINTQSISDWKILCTAINRYHKTILAAKCFFCSSLIRFSSSNPHALWNTINNILHRTVKRYLSSSSPLSALPQMFARVHAYKISKLHCNLQSNPSSTPAHFLRCTSPLELHHFTSTTLCEILY